VTLRAAEASVVGLHPLFGLPSSAFARFWGCRRAPRQPTCPAPHGSSRALLRRRPRRLLEPKLKIENKFSTFFCKILVNIFAAKCWQCFSIQLFKKNVVQHFSLQNVENIRCDHWWSGGWKCQGRE
jgi:hypothetical protein